MVGSPRAMSSPRIAVLDVDGTLVDTNYQHALAWYRAFRSLGEIYPVWRIHRLIGMGGDQLVSALGGDDVERRIGDAARERWVGEVDPMMGETALLPGARELIVALKDRGHRVVLASSGKPHHVDRALDLLDARELADAWTTSEDVEETKPAPDLLQVALKKLGEPVDAPSVVVGDSVYDVEAAKNAGMPAIVVRSGGFGDDELRNAGAVAVFDTPADLIGALDELDLL
ncbi:haloacid dehalogenase superfamily, subfamily IA, variant 3 with third motif having DD or ED/haloacid dehalogenase superfamily, subfamily IA, variant 1 with third motif having Dx(3-4)D or Dx(3-4)E [Blastococcus aggregatus]|uniref:Haloacid dehalogenase superfamily, subfamily IA, variant 3 with third motif having DD or ED/haloacid dehalogenase superfamily, subfamily IA, variant 1 with third motif having Dx(3-4)D or Dx(3-4)E n=2 Tax=Blastococcus aggregatus TaxID=38502 RepID=A0A285V5K8_9ACTN|nr:haloacid dehalogenase superfamily, subfamily IA, variant 3 with third motif having DD or ED/haloacid dehalogenase superfamily, subfamily IA, variant 1 with third motif having Dx(3-4)D or Dx(3-4)E [Blastococcus aggregatus]